MTSLGLKTNRLDIEMRGHRNCQEKKLKKSRQRLYV